MNSFSLRIATPEREVFSGSVDHVSLNTPLGREGFLARALPRISVLEAGVVEITAGEEKFKLYCQSGIYCIDEHGMTVITAECNDNDRQQDDAVPESNGDRQFKYAKARIASSMINPKERRNREDTF